MAGIANALTIREIEQILFAGGPRYEARSWSAAGVECRRHQHRYSGEQYEFSLDVIRIHFREAGRSRWEALLVSERWTAGARDLPIRATKWLKLVSGNPAELRAWIRRSRPLLPAEPHDAPLDIRKPDPQLCRRRRSSP
jgi:hypothetical protein